jgi:hypothetical protein
MNTHAFLLNCLLFTRLLRQVGLPIGLDQTLRFTQALAWIDIGSRDQVYYTARCLLVTRHEHLRLFDALFNRFWRCATGEDGLRPQRMPLAPRHKKKAQPFTIVSYMAARARLGDPEIDITDKSGTFSYTEVLQRKEFSELTPDELEQVKRLIQEMQWRISMRRTRRRVAERNGEFLHVRRVLREAARYNGVPLRLARQRRKVKQRPLILIADISGSMEKYARLLLQFLYSVSYSLRRVECFVFGTRLTRITHQLKLRNIDRALDQAAREVVDWAGGTRIGESLATFNRRWSRRVLGRGVVVLIISDGWERGDTALLSRAMQSLSRRCYRLIWLNPLLGKRSYQPKVDGMAVALPFVDDFLPIHNLQSLSALAARLEVLGR